MNSIFESKLTFERLFKENYSTLCRVARAYVRNEQIAEEIVCETFVKLWNNQYTIQINSSLEDYLTRSLINTCIDYYRKEKRYKENTVHIEDNTIVCASLADLDQNPLDYMITKDQQAKINMAIEQLPERYKMTFKLARIDGLSYEEVAQAMNISKNTVKSNLRDCLSLLKEKLKDLTLFILLIINLFN